MPNKGLAESWARQPRHPVPLRNMNATALQEPLGTSTPRTLAPPRPAAPSHPVCLADQQRVHTSNPIHGTASSARRSPSYPRG